MKGFEFWDSLESKSLEGAGRETSEQLLPPFHPPCVLSLSPELSSLKIRFWRKCSHTRDPNTRCGRGGPAGNSVQADIYGSVCAYAKLQFREWNCSHKSGSSLGRQWWHRSHLVLDVTSVLRIENVSKETNKTLTQNPLQTYRCESLHPSALKKNPRHQP